jgi:hypothetical protein
MIFLLVASYVVSTANAAAYTSSVPIRGHQHCRDSSSRSFDTTCSAVMTRSKYDLGLLTGIDDATSAEYYSSKLVVNSTDDVQWLLKLGLLWDAATKDAAMKDISTIDYVKNVKDALKKFRKSGQVHDREDFYQFLEKVYETEGCFLLVLGGKSVGKSLVLRDFARKLKNSTMSLPLLANARDFTGASLSEGMLLSFKKFFQRELRGFIITEQDTLKLLKSFMGLFIGMAQDAAKGVNELLGKDPFRPADVADLSSKFDTFIDSLIKSQEFSDIEDLQRFISLAKDQGKHPVLIIDEANQVLGLGEVNVRHRAF